MTNCLWCGREELPKIRLIDIVGLTKIKTEPLCRQCKKQLSYLDDQSTCRGCGRPEDGEEYCKDCIRWQNLYPHYDFHNEALYEYNEFMKEWIEAYKFKGDYRLGKVFAEPLKYKVEKRADTESVIIPIPISKKSMDIRGFNQVKGLLDFAGLSYNEVLVHVGIGEKQSSKNRQQRMTSSQPFEIKPSKRIEIECRNILLIDDVYTTGRTLFHAADCLFLNGAANVQSLTIAR
ncbi:ComF family protein [Desemzia sp. FAM 23991]|uniref:ComF family protein n=1 Tax=unclassified Desemzia TaxID=2685243 RepID=UPI003886462A